MGYRVAAHAEGLDGTEIAIETGIDTIEHGMYLNRRPDLLERMAALGPGARPDARLLLRRRGRRRPRRRRPRRRRAPSAEPPPTWSHLLVDLALHNLEQADLTLQRGATPPASRSPPATTGRRSTTSGSRSSAWSTTGSAPRGARRGDRDGGARARPRRPASGRSSRAGSPTSSSSTATRSSGSASCATASRIWLVLQLGDARRRRGAGARPGDGASDDRRRRALGAGGERGIPAAHRAGVPEGRARRTRARRVRVIGRARVVPVEHVLAERRVPARRGGDERRAARSRRGAGCA